MILSLCGMMGCGKSSTGAALARLLGWPFLDLDAVIEEREARSIPEIFAADGEAGFRRAERAALEGILDAPESDLVLALGGGTVLTPACADLIRHRTCCIYLRTSADTLAARLQDQTDARPLLQTPDAPARLAALLEDRESLYETVAAHIVDTDGLDPETAARTIRDLLP